MRVVRDGDVVDRALWTKRARTGATWIDDLVHPGRLLELFADGATVVLQSLQRWWPPIAQFCHQMEEVLGHPVQANAYLSPPGAAGLAPHHDTHDVFVLQVHGSKHWVVREPVVEAPLARHRSDHRRAAEQPVLLDVELRAGDCLYLPRGFVHAARAQTATSLHLTIGVLATTVHDLLRRLVDRTADVPSLRRNVPRDFATNPEVAERTVGEAVRELTSWLEGLDHRELGSVLRQGVEGKRQPLLDGHLLDLVASDDVDDRSVVQVRPGAVRRIEVVGDRVRLVTGDREVDLPVALAATLERLTDGSSLEVGSLAGALDDRSRQVLVRRLLREGVLRLVPGSPS